MTSTLVQYENVARSYARTVDMTVKRGDVDRQLDYWRENIGRVAGIEDFLGDQRLYRFAMEAFGLEDQIFAKGLMRKILEEGVSDRLSQANKMTDRRFREFAAAFGFAEVGTANVRSPERMETVAKNWVQLAIEKEQGEDNPGVRLAMYFERTAGKVTSWYQVLGDRALSEVVRTVLRLPPQVANLDIDRYAALLEERLDLEDLRDPEKRDDLVRRFTILYDLDNGPPSGAGLGPGSVASLIQPLSGPNRGPAPIIGLSPDVMLSLASIRRF